MVLIGNLNKRPMLCPSFNHIRVHFLENNLLARCDVLNTLTPAIRVCIFVSRPAVFSKILKFLKMRRH